MDNTHLAAVLSCKEDEDLQKIADTLVTLHSKGAEILLQHLTQSLTILKASEKYNLWIKPENG